MNLLAHLFLTRSAPPEIMVGNFIADRIKGKNYREHPEGVAKGILLHRSIDSFTDEHPLTMESKRMLHPYHGKWAGVVIDILNDHFLASEWDRYSPNEELEDLAERMHGILQDHRKLLSKKDRWILDRMMEDEWLVNYRYREGIRRAFEGLSKRTGEKGMNKALNTLDELEDPLRKKFRTFFPELIEHTESLLTHETDETGPPPDR